MCHICQTFDSSSAAHLCTFLLFHDPTRWLVTHSAACVSPPALSILKAPYLTRIRRGKTISDYRPNFAIDQPISSQCFLFMVITIFQVFLFSASCHSLIRWKSQYTAIYCWGHFSDYSFLHFGFNYSPNSTIIWRAKQLATVGGMRICDHTNYLR